jgi:hypothetical protein
MIAVFSSPIGDYGRNTESRRSATTAVKELKSFRAKDLKRKFIPKFFGTEKNNNFPHDTATLQGF